MPRTPSSASTSGSAARKPGMNSATRRRSSGLAPARCKQRRTPSHTTAAAASTGQKSALVPRPASWRARSPARQTAENRFGAAPVADQVHRIRPPSPARPPAALRRPARGAVISPPRARQRARRAARSAQRADARAILFDCGAVVLVPARQVGAAQHRRDLACSRNRFSIFSTMRCAINRLANVDAPPVACSVPGMVNTPSPAARGCRSRYRTPRTGACRWRCGTAAFQKLFWM